MWLWSESSSARLRVEATAYRPSDRGMTFANSNVPVELLSGLVASIHTVSSTVAQVGSETLGEVCTRPGSR